MAQRFCCLPFSHHIIPVPAPTSVVLTARKSHSVSNYIRPGSSVNLTCTITMSQSVTEIDLPLLVVEVRLSKEGMSHDLGNATVTTGTTFSYTKEMRSFERIDSGNYTCNTTVKSAHTHVVSSRPDISEKIRVTTG